MKNFLKVIACAAMLFGCDTMAGDDSSSAAAGPEVETGVLDNQDDVSPTVDEVQAPTLHYVAIIDGELVLIPVTDGRVPVTFGVQGKNMNFIGYRYKVLAFEEGDVYCELESDFLPEKPSMRLPVHEFPEEGIVGPIWLEFTEWRPEWSGKSAQLICEISCMTDPTKGVVIEHDITLLDKKDWHLLAIPPQQ